MRQTAKALNDFANSFHIPAYSTDTVPDDVTLPYITFPITEPEWNQKATWYLQGWYKTTSNAEMFAKADEIIREIGTGLIINTEDGYLVIYPETPLVQLIVNGDERSFYINLSINAYHTPGK